MRRPWVEAQVKERQQSSWFVGLATAGVVAYAVGPPSIVLYRLLIVPSGSPFNPGHAGYGAAAVACYLPLEVWLVLSSARDTRWSRGQGWALVALAALAVGMIPVVGVGWLPTLDLVAALVLLRVRPPWSLVLFAGLWAIPAPVAFAFGHPQWAAYYTIGLPTIAMPLVVAVWLIRTARQLQAARLAFAQEAVIRERLRIDDQLRRTVGTALEAIATHGDRAVGAAASDPSAASQELRSLVDAARGTLADARRMVGGYQEVSFRAELDTAVTLLAAAGIDARLLLPYGELPVSLDPAQRAALRRGIARLLHDDQPPARATITVARDGAQVQVELRADGTDPRARG